MKTTIAKRCALIGITTIAFGVCAGHASAASLDETVPTIVVKYNDLDLTQPRDAKRLYRRIQTAAQLVCEKNRGEGLASMPLYHACLDQAVTHAVATVSSTQVTQIHEAATQHVANRS
jgi:UrcA family protein